MGDLDNFDYNDVMDQINDQNPHVQEMASVSNDSNLPSSISGFGIDENNPEENNRYIQENQNLQAAGFQNRQSQHDSGLTRSISRTRSSESIPRSSESPINQGNPENQIADLSCANVDDDVIDGAEQNENEDYWSPYDLALEKGYAEQALLYYDIQTALDMQELHIKYFYEDIFDEKIADHNRSSLRQKVINRMNEIIEREEEFKTWDLKDFTNIQRDTERLILFDEIYVCKDILRRNNLTSKKREIVQQRLDMSINIFQALSLLDLSAESTTQEYPETSSDYAYSSDSNAQRLDQPGPSNNSMYAKDPKAAQSYTLAQRIQRQNSSDSDVEDTNGKSRSKQHEQEK